jgi:hypothetical protein
MFGSLAVLCKPAQHHGNPVMGVGDLRAVR